MLTGKYALHEVCAYTARLFICHNVNMYCMKCENEKSEWKFSMMLERRENVL